MFGRQVTQLAEVPWSIQEALKGPSGEPSSSRDSEIVISILKVFGCMWLICK
jgi:hypothetical protein